MSWAEKYRPQTLDDICGQRHLLGKHNPITFLAEQKLPQSLIFYGPPGTGKTCTARVLANYADRPFFSLNATNASVKDIQALVKEHEKIVLYLDEIQYFNKKQQQSLLPYVEDGSIILIAATTENPYHSIYDAILSRCSIFEFKRIPKEDLAERLQYIAKQEGISEYFDTEVLTYIAQVSAGDMRRATNLLELMHNVNPETKVTKEIVKNSLPTATMSGFDTSDDVHYNLISGLQKSIRGSDPDAAVFYLVRLCEGGDIISPCRRLLAIACEDIGLANPTAIQHTLACTIAAEHLGLPEALKPLTQAVLYLALSQKSASNEATFMPAQEVVKMGKGAVVPSHLRTACAPGYVWPHAYPYHWIDQQYMPDDLVGTKFYEPGDNPFEQQAFKYWEHVREINKDLKV